MLAAKLITNSNSGSKMGRNPNKTNQNPDTKLILNFNVTEIVEGKGSSNAQYGGNMETISCLSTDVLRLDGVGGGLEQNNQITLGKYEKMRY